MLRALHKGAAQQAHAAACAFDLSGFGALFESFEDSAFRFEMLQYFDVASEDLQIEQYRKGISPPKDANAQWGQTIRQAVAAGKSFPRVRFIEEPISDYIQFEINWGYRPNVAAGDEVRVLTDLSHVSSLSTLPILKDYWLFDDRKLVLMEYDFRGTFLGASTLPEKWVSCYFDVKTELLANSVAIQETKFWQQDL